MAVWIIFGITLLWDWNENWPFPVLQPLLSFPNLLTYWEQHLNGVPVWIAISFSSKHSWPRDWTCASCILVGGFFMGSTLDICRYKIKVQIKCVELFLVSQLCPTLCNSTDCSLPGSSVHRDSPGKNTGVGSHVLLRGIFPNQGSNSGLLYCRWILYHLSHLVNTENLKKNWHTFFFFL